MVRSLIAPMIGMVLGACALPAPPPVVEGEGGRWEALPELAGGPRQETCVVALGGEVVVVGGVDEVGATVAHVEAYAPATASWRRLADLPVPLHHANCAVVDDSLVLGGFLLGAGFMPDGRTFVYSPDDDAWREGAPMPDGSQRGAAGAVAHQGYLYVLGGRQSGSVALVSRYHVEEDAWQEQAPLPQALDHLAALAVGDRLFVVGGRTDGVGRHTARLLELDWSTGAATERAPMPTSRAGFAAGALDGEIVVAGGEGDATAETGVFAEVEIYQPETDSWRALLPMRTPRHGMGAGVVDGALYVPGGADRQGFDAVATHERFVPSPPPD